jgi:hypothetical protein
MRTLLVLYCLMIFSISEISAQNDFRTLDKKTYDLYKKGDYKNLKRTADTMLAGGMDYYYLRMRLGIMAFENHSYAVAVENFTKALKFNSLDTVSGTYIYYSFLLSGRMHDASLYLSSLSDDMRLNSLRNVKKSWLTNVYAGGGFAGYDYFTYNKNRLYYEAIKSYTSLNTGLDASFLDRFKLSLMYTNFRKNGMFYSALDSTGTDLNFTQNQVYAKL